MGTEKERVNVVFEDADIRLIREYAAFRGVSASLLVREAVKGRLARWKREMQGDAGSIGDEDGNSMSRYEDMLLKSRADALASKDDVAGRVLPYKPHGKGLRKHKKHR